ncbi:MAG: hypothetical protein LKK19_06170 [Bacteroidales bacterium]|jgi:hypothetical protein|nr:hypothetical protein [Bacteroidales bacterium]MCI2122271.1 hypothetical protein [Bacteroidales bacterium]MCI2144652.1 hypothetical protein [Bacteroidales bacterium]
MIRKRTIKTVKWKGYALFALSLLLAFFVWFLHNMSLEYSTHLQFKVNLTTNLVGHEPNSLSEETLIIRGKGRGFYISKQRLEGQPCVLDLNVDGNMLVKEGAEFYRLAVSDIRERITESIGPSFDIEYIDRDSLTFKFQERYYRAVPIEARSLINFRPQWMQVGNMSFSPDSVEIYGQKEVVDAIGCVHTKMIRINNASKSRQGIVELDIPAGVRCSAKEAFYNVRIERYVEENEEVELTVKNLPEGKKLILLPSKVRITYRTAFGAPKTTGEDFVIDVDYDEFIASDNKKVIPHYESSNCELFSYTISPAIVECILTDE